MDVDWEQRAKAAEQALEQMRLIMSTDDQSEQLARWNAKMESLHSLLEGAPGDDTETLLKNVIAERRTMIRELRIAKKQRDILEKALHRAANHIALAKCDGCNISSRGHENSCYTQQALASLTSVAPAP
jgi:hypothetical protein